jgi:hypothetical protein
MMKDGCCSGQESVVISDLSGRRTTQWRPTPTMITIEYKMQCISPSRPSARVALARVYRRFGSHELARTEPNSPELILDMCEITIAKPQIPNNNMYRSVLTSKQAMSFHQIDLGLTFAIESVLRTDFIRRIHQRLTTARPSCNLNSTFLNWCHEMLSCW